MLVLDYADGGYAAIRVTDTCPIRTEVMRQAGNQFGFTGIPRCRIVGQFFEWISVNKPMVTDLKATIEPIETCLCAASTVLLLQRLAR